MSLSSIDESPRKKHPRISNFLSTIQDGLGNADVIDKPESIFPFLRQQREKIARLLVQLKVDDICDAVSNRLVRWLKAAYESQRQFGEEDELAKEFLSLSTKIDLARRSFNGNINNRWQESEEINKKRSFARYFPKETNEQLHQIGFALDTLTSDHKTGEDVQKVLEDAGIKLTWKHTKDMGSYAILHRSPNLVSGGSFRTEGTLVIVALPKGHRAPTHMHKGGVAGLDGEFTMVWRGSLKYQCYEDMANNCEAPIGRMRVSPDKSVDQYAEQEEMAVAIYWQPQPAKDLEAAA